MRLKAARIQNYRSIKDTGWFDVEQMKTILVGPNEAGKTTVLRALEAINPPDGKSTFEWLRDYPRSLLSDLGNGDESSKSVLVSSARFGLDDDDIKAAKGVDSDFKAPTHFEVLRYLDNKQYYRGLSAYESPKMEECRGDLVRIKKHIEKNAPGEAENDYKAILASLDELLLISDSEKLASNICQETIKTLNAAIPFVDEENNKEVERLNTLKKLMSREAIGHQIGSLLLRRVPKFVYFSSYFSVKPSIHLEHLAIRVEQSILDDDAYDFGNLCLLKLLGFTPRELADLGKVKEPIPPESKTQPNPAAPQQQQKMPLPIARELYAKEIKEYKDKLDRRSYQLNGASVKLSGMISEVWLASEDRQERMAVKIKADSQYLKVVVEDELSVEVELDQRSAGFQWLVSFFIVFMAQAKGDYKNAILLLDEPGLSLHGLKQRQFRSTLSKLAEKNQTLFTTHSPFLVGPDELDLVRVVEMPDRGKGTIVHTNITADDPRSLYPLQAALGYDLAQSLFSQKKNLVVEGLTDLWYIEGVAALLRTASIADLDQKIAILPANTASKVTYFCTMLHSQKLHVAALLDSDTAGDNAAKQEDFVRMLTEKRILRTKDFYQGTVSQPEVEDLFRETLIKIGKDDLGWNVTAEAAQQATRPIVDVFAAKVGSSFSKYRLAKAFLKWSSNHEAKDLAQDEQEAWKKLVEATNKALK